MPRLLTIVIDYIMHNLPYYQKAELSSLALLPPHIKNRMLKKLTGSYTFIPKHDLAIIQLLCVLTHENSTRISLVSIKPTDQILNILAKHSNWTSIKLEEELNKSAITPEGLINLLQKSHKLQKLSVRHCTAINDKVLQCISNNCPNLQLLDINGCTQVTDEGLQHLKDIKLIGLNVAKAQISDVGIIMLVEGKCGLLLEELCLDGCNVTSVGIHRITQCCPNLTCFDFGFAGDTDLEALSFQKQPVYISWEVRF